MRRQRGLCGNKCTKSHEVDTEAIVLVSDHDHQGNEGISK
jgi:hypothetical protein